MNVGAAWLLRIFSILPLGCAINTAYSLPSTGIHPSVLLLFFFFAWGPNRVVVCLGVDVADVAAAAAHLVLLVVVNVGRRRRPPLLLWRRAFGVMTSFCAFMAEPLLGFCYHPLLPPLCLSSTWGVCCFVFRYVFDLLLGWSWRLIVLA